MIAEHENLKQENSDLRAELDTIKREYEQVTKQLASLQRQVERTNEAKEVVNLCKLLLAGSLVPIISLFLIYSSLDGSVFVSSPEL